MAPITSIQTGSKSQSSTIKQSLVDIAHGASEKHVSRTVKSNRKALGQFFTPPPVATFMAELFTQFPPECRVLDAGAGVGVLSAALIEHLISTEKCSSIHTVAYETDPIAVPYLEGTLKECHTAAIESGCAFSKEVRVSDFISDVAWSRRSMFNAAERLFDLVIMNPPYFKLRADSEHATLAKKIGPAQPNAYSLFMAAGIERLRPGGEMVTITPRSFCNGLYFRDFRNWLMERGELLQVHTFLSRNDAFRESKVLQENVITHFRRSEVGIKHRSVVTISRSVGRDLTNVSTETMQKKRVIDNSFGDNLICVPETTQDGKILELVNKWPGRFNDTELLISTGPVVMFRTRKFHTNESSQETVPLLTSHHICNGQVSWPREKKKWPNSFLSVPASQKHLLPTRHYVLLKRFSAKEERRRLSAGTVCADNFSTSQIAVENHVNYIRHSERDLNIDEAVGLSAFFNSALMDRYFRTLSGNTQVNATEIRSMKFPELEIISQIGRSLLVDKSADLESVVLNALNVPVSIRKSIEEYTS